jgi:hypothetical protein
MTTIPSQPIGKHNKHKPQARIIEVRSNELWQAIALGLTGLAVRQVIEDAPSGRMSKDTMKFSRSEPDWAFLRPPCAQFRTMVRSLEGSQG